MSPSLRFCGFFSKRLACDIVSHAPSCVATVNDYEFYFDGFYGSGSRHVADVGPEASFVPGTVLGTGHVETSKSLSSLNNGPIKTRLCKPGKTGRTDEPALV